MHSQIDMLLTVPHVRQLTHFALAFEELHVQLSVSFFSKALPTGTLDYCDVSKNKHVKVKEARNSLKNDLQSICVESETLQVSSLKA